MTQLHRPQVRATSARCHRTVCHSWNIPFLFLCFFFFFFYFFILCCSFHLSIPGVVSKFRSMFYGMMNNRRKVLDRDLLVYDHTSWQKIYSMPTEKSAWLGSSTEATVIQASSVMCLDNNTIFVALDVALWEDIAVRFLENFHRLLGKL